mmetsp:Transcript_8667/g.22296  ORF Transcript_8667/g.22296 Transcript_8667/m.22296 type:complete len:218 (-) Transcript_8667:201-854(-)
MEGCARSSAVIIEWNLSPRMALPGSVLMLVTTALAWGQRTSAPIKVPIGLGRSSQNFAEPVVCSTAVVFVMGLFNAPFRSTGGGKDCTAVDVRSMSCKQYSAVCHSFGILWPKRAVKNFIMKPQTMCSHSSRPSAAPIALRSNLTLSHTLVTTDGRPEATASRRMPTRAFSVCFSRTGFGSTAPSTSLAEITWSAASLAANAALTIACALWPRFATR